MGEENLFNKDAFPSKAHSLVTVEGKRGARLEHGRRLGFSQHSLYSPHTLNYSHKSTETL